MDELSLYVLDIVMNSVRAGAKNIEILIDEEGEWLTFSVKDDGCGMTEEQVKKLSDPFFTTRKTRKVGLGVPFLRMLAEMTGGFVEIKSVHESVSGEHGTELLAKFGRHHIDFIPVGDLTGTVMTLIQGSPDIDFVYRHRGDGFDVNLDTRELKAVLGEDISLAEPEVLAWIKDYLNGQYSGGEG